MWNRYFVYILECNDKSYYTGVTSRLEFRYWEHLNGVDPTCYTYSRRPLELVYFEETNDVWVAINREKQIKGWSRAKKQALINNNFRKVERIIK